MNAQRRVHAWRWLFVVTALEAAAGAAELLRVTLQSSGVSVARLASILILGVFMILGVALASRSPTWTRQPVGGYALALAGITAALLAAALFLLRYLEPVRLLPYFQRLGLLLGFLLVASLQTLLVLLLTRNGIQSSALRELKPIIWPAAVATGILLCMLLIVSVTRLGLTPDSAYWGETGVPILGWQLFLALLLGGVVAWIAHRRKHPPSFDVLVATGIWLVALSIWLAVPNSVLQNSFYAPIRPPTTQPFPNSDAGYYDSMAQSLLIGYPYLSEIPSRPLYVVVLAALHRLLGERYELIIAGQTIVLALVPVLLYVLGVLLHGRLAGVVAALAAVAREWTSLVISSDTRVSNTKMLLVDLPTLLLVLAACVFTVRWLQRRAVREAVLAGGVSGLLLLMRTQAALILPAAALLALMVLGPRRRAAYLQITAFAAAAALTVLPWLVHNYRVSGQFSLEAAFQYRIIASQYQYTGNLDIGNVDLQGRSLAGTLLTFVIRDPRFVFGFIANHAMATQVSGILALPLFHEYDGLLADINLYWLDWSGRLGPPNMALLVFYMTLIGLGLAAAWTRLRWAGLVPLGFSLAYSLANGVARFSGWRYDLPADWIAYFYLAVGAAELLTLVASIFGFPPVQPHQNASVPSPPASPAKTVVWLLAAIFLIGWSPWLGEALTGPPRYAGSSATDIAALLSEAPSVRAIGIDRSDIAAFRESPAAVLEVGRILYPRFFTRGNGLASAHPWPAYAPRDFPRLGFLLLNGSRHDVIVPTREVPQDFEHAADAIVLGCAAGDYIEARLVLLEDSDKVYRGAPLAEPCP